MLGVYTGTSISNLREIASDDDGGADLCSLLWFRANSGTTYYLVVDGYSEGYIQLSLDMLPMPANDDFENSTLITQPICVVTGDTRGMTKQYDEPSHANNSGGASLWWRWTAPVSGRVNLSTDGSSFDTLLAVYTGSDLAGLVPVASDDESGPHGTSNLSFTADQGATYHIAVDGYEGETGIAQLFLEFLPGQGCPPPANDTFTSAVIIRESSGVVLGSNVGASKESGEPDHNFWEGGKSVWWTWTAPSDGRLWLLIERSSFPAFIAIYTGEDVSGLELLKRASGDSDIYARAGVTYHIAIDGMYGEEGNTWLAFNHVPAPANDAFPGEILTPFGSIILQGSNEGATKEAGEPNHAFYPGGASVWWTWTAPSNAVVTVTTEDSDIDTLLAVYTGNTVSSLIRVAADNDSGPGTTSTLKFNCFVGTTYHLAVDGCYHEEGTIRLRITHTAAPVNDMFLWATTITGAAVSVQGSNVNATAEAGEPNHCGRTATKSIWWKWTAPFSGAVTLDTFGSSFDTLLAVYTGSNVSTLNAVAFNDDDDFYTTSFVSFWAFADMVYYVVVDGRSGQEGSIRLLLNQIAGPAQPNDMFAAAIPISGTNISVAGSNVGATAEIAEPEHARLNATRSVWWRWTAPITGQVTINTHGSMFNTVLAVYTGTSVSSLERVASNDDSDSGNTSSVSFTAAGGTVYQIAVDGYGGESGQVRLALTQTSQSATLAQALDSSTLVWSSTDTVGWYLQTAVTHDGVDAAESGVITHNQESWLQTSVTGPTTLSFWWKVSSEHRYDYLEFYVDGVLQAGRISGEVNWQQKSYTISPGTHTLRWSYKKDETSNAGQDRAWLDQVSYVPGASTSEFTYTTNNGTITITKYTGPGGAVSIPGTISALPVTAVAWSAFQNNSTVTSVTMPDSIRSIGNFAFNGCSSLANIVIGNGVQTIGGSAFQSCSSLASIAIPGGVTNIGLGAFSGCTSLTSIPVNSTNAHYVSVGGVLFSIDGKTLLAYPAKKAGGSYNVPGTVTDIMSYAFASSTALTNIVIPVGVTSIGSGAFNQCVSLSSIFIPASATNLADNPFFWNLKLPAISVAIDNPAYASVGGVLFDKQLLRLIAYPSGKQGSHYAIPETVTSIGQYAFARTGPTSITVPANVTNVGFFAFEYCYNLTGVYFRGNAPSGDNSYLFLHSDQATVYYLSGATGWGPTFGGRPTALWTPAPVASPNGLFDSSLIDNSNTTTH